MGWFNETSSEKATRERQQAARRALDRNNERERAAKIQHQTRENEQLQRKLRQAERERAAAKAAAKAGKKSGWW